MLMRLVYLRSSNIQKQIEATIVKQKQQQQKTTSTAVAAARGLPLTF